MSAELLNVNDWFNWSLNQLSREFGIARETVQRRLRDANVNPSGERRGHPVYSVGQSAKAILAPENHGGSVFNDPEKMMPKERRDWYASELDRKKLELATGESVYASDAREQMAIIAKTGLQVLETLPDILERDYKLDPEIIAGIETKIDELRNDWAAMLEESA